MRPRVVVGRDVEVLQESTEEIELIGKVRLRPGFVIEIVPRPAGITRPVWAASVQSWRIRVLGSNGPIYRGVCRWFPSSDRAPGELLRQTLEVRLKP